MAIYYPQTVIYEEKKTTYWLLASILFFVCLIIYFGYKMKTLDLWIRLLPLIPLLFVIFVMYNIAFYSVKVFDDKTLQFGFPKWHIKLQPHEIKFIEEIGSYRPMKDFGGLGWRVGRKDGKWKRGYLYTYFSTLVFKPLNRQFIYSVPPAGVSYGRNYSCKRCS